VPVETDGSPLGLSALRGNEGSFLAVPRGHDPDPDVEAELKKLSASRFSLDALVEASVSCRCNARHTSRTTRHVNKVDRRAAIANKRPTAAPWRVPNKASSFVLERAGTRTEITNKQAMIPTVHIPEQEIAMGLFATSNFDRIISRFQRRDTRHRLLNMTTMDTRSGVGVWAAIAGQGTSSAFSTGYQMSDCNRS
jgi:hypothetical protein